MDFSQIYGAGPDEPLLDGRSACTPVAWRTSRGRVAALATLLLAALSQPALAQSEEKAREQAIQLMRQRIEALPLSREEKDAMLERKLKAMAPPSAQDERWSKAREIRYRIVGEFDGRWPLDPTGDAQARDRVQIEFVLDATTGRIKDNVAVRNEATDVRDLQPQPKGCRVPELHGKFELYTLEAIAPLSADGPLWPSAVVKFSRQYPAMTAAAVCTGKRSVAARTEQEARQLRVPTPSEFRRSKSDQMTLKELGWTWTYEAIPR